MKKFEVYRNIRKRAMIFGLPISFFALEMLSIIASLMVIIFSFSLAMIMAVLIFNTILYIALTRLTNSQLSLTFTKVFPKIISNKKSSSLDYGQD
jgi:type IV secretory pathway VirB3-like protein